MESKSQTTLKAVKELGGEVSAWEHRTIFLKTEAEMLQRKNEQIRKEIESALALAQQELDKKRIEARQEKEKTDQERSQLESQKAEFQLILTEFKKERTQLEREKDKLHDLQVDAERLRQKASNFLVTVRKASEAL